MGLEEFKNGVRQRSTIDTEAIGISIPVHIHFTSHTVKDSGEFDELVELHCEDIRSALMNSTDAESFDIMYGEASEIPIEEATWD